MPKGLRRRYGRGDLHFITFSCYQRRPLLASVRARNRFVEILGEVRERYRFALVGYVVMPDHIHLLMSEPQVGTPSTVMQVLKQRFSRQVQRQREGERAMRREDSSSLPFWQRRFYDFNVWSSKKRSEKLHYMHFNPVQRGLVDDPKHWPWSSYGFYSTGDPGLIRIDPD